MASRCVSTSRPSSTRNWLSITENTRKGVGLKTGMETRRAVRQPGCSRLCAPPVRIRTLRWTRRSKWRWVTSMRMERAHSCMLVLECAAQCKQRCLSQVCLPTENMWEIAVPAHRKMRQPRGPAIPSWQLRIMQRHWSRPERDFCAQSGQCREIRALPGKNRRRVSFLMAPTLKV